MTNSQLKSPAKKPPHPSQSTLPHAIAQSTLAMAKLNRQCGTVSDEAFPQPNTPPVVASIICDVIVWYNVCINLTL